MNKLDRIILDQHERIVIAGTKAHEILADTQGEIMAAATPELTWEIFDDYKRTSLDRSNKTLTAQMSGHAFRLAQWGFIQPHQGYVGGILFDGLDRIVHGVALSLKEAEDPIQAANGALFYPPMTWAKALRAEAYKYRSETEKELSMSSYLAEHGFTLGSFATMYGDIFGTTGFMPGDRISSMTRCSEISEHVELEEVEAFKLSGFCDQSVLEPEILKDDPIGYAKDLILAGGRLN